MTDSRKLSHAERILLRTRLQQEIKNARASRRSVIECELKLIDEAEQKRAKALTLFLTDPRRIKY